MSKTKGATTEMPNYYGVDSGCKYAISCLRCPFPKCLEELPNRIRPIWAKEWRLQNGKGS